MMQGGMAKRNHICFF